MERKPSLTPQIILAFVLASLGMALLFAGFFVPPLGGIEPSVLVAYGEVMTFAGALFGIDYHYRR
ncbi:MULTISPECIES: hypothetical protein [unclassified Porphyromonas]|uniref:hypothetical protein n=1 Tax=unclassified Porphyromonas TaxID=2645799 RepID=UPI00052D3CF8|nr:MULTISPECIES: hypothetical protein [unclassified Porphyromonas]KGN83643.1 hypothetical protein HQ41_06950 [Porphyromonas sp. COT-290 OH860]KGO00187.1 hypothetical protein HQ48_06840 [Porphyromonas sp. COT-290 OH3588]